MNAVRCVAVAILAAGLAGCGEAAQSTTGSVEAPAPAATASPSPAASASPSTPARITGFEFEPRVIRVAKGGRVTWKNADAANHTVTFARRPGDLGNVREGGKLSARFVRAGTFSYVCVYHPNMRGKIIVR